MRPRTNLSCGWLCRINAETAEIAEIAETARPSVPRFSRLSRHSSRDQARETGNLPRSDLAGRRARRSQGQGSHGSVHSRSACHPTQSVAHFADSQQGFRQPVRIPASRIVVSSSLKRHLVSASVVQKVGGRFKLRSTFSRTSVPFGSLPAKASCCFIQICSIRYRSSSG